MMLHYSVLASGSHGNATLIRSPKTSILIDCGLLTADLQQRLFNLGCQQSAIGAVLVTHEHIDHTCGLRAFRKRSLARIYATTKTAAVIGGAERINPGDAFEVGDVRVIAFRVMHDAVDPVGYALECGDSRLILATDLGSIPEELGAEATDIILESNWDEEIMKAGPYAIPVKRRVIANHLSNAQVSRFISKAMAPSVQHLTLFHVSEETNNRALVRSMAEDALKRRTACSAVEIRVA